MYLQSANHAFQLMSEMSRCFLLAAYSRARARASDNCVHVITIASMLICWELLQHVKTTIMIKRGDLLINAAEKGDIDRCER